ncbi:hypothetical protein B0H16DRAFT_1596536 [Mycena metata]|uniref:Uncharacterized protein n=1 Tax=Mycena metata TaxID=1033252 RepID=A0AAD7HMW2_9AGAR|nr:hypothetical protein B0H16DRAFT_1596536 [Mycena metata]
MLLTTTHLPIILVLLQCGGLYNAAILPPSTGDATSEAGGVEEDSVGPVAPPPTASFGDSSGPGSFPTTFGSGLFPHTFTPSPSTGLSFPSDTPSLYPDGVPSAQHSTNPGIIVAAILIVALCLALLVFGVCHCARRRYGPTRRPPSEPGVPSPRWWIPPLAPRVPPPPYFPRPPSYEHDVGSAAPARQSEKSGSDYPFAFSPIEPPPDVRRQRQSAA